MPAKRNFKETKEFKKLVARIEDSVLKNKTYAQIAREQKVHHRKVSNIAREYCKYDKKEFIRYREAKIAMMILNEIRPVDIAKKLGISRQLVNSILNNIVWEDYEEYNKLGLKL